MEERKARFCKGCGQGACILLIISGIWAILAPWRSLDAAEDPVSAARVLQFEERMSAPGFAIEDVEGNRVKLEDFRGKVVLLNFWATW
ncbi:MAG: redoxin domain-containing protein [Candidatus Aerophobetes bacterium]